MRRVLMAALAVTLGGCTNEGAILLFGNPTLPVDALQTMTEPTGRGSLPLGPKTYCAMPDGTRYFRFGDCPAGHRPISEGEYNL